MVYNFVEVQHVRPKLCLKKIHFDFTVQIVVDNYFVHIDVVSQELQGPGYTSNPSVKPRLLKSSVRPHSNMPSTQSTASFLSHVRTSPTIHDANDIIYREF